MNTNTKSAAEIVASLKREEITHAEITVQTETVARWTNYINGRDVETVHTFKPGDVVRLGSWRPEGMNATTSDGFEMFVFWRYLEEMAAEEPKTTAATVAANTIESECKQIARDIANDIERIVCGEVWYNGCELEPLPEENEDGERLDEDGNEIEPATLWDWVDKQLGDIRFEVNQQREVTGGRVLCCFGGPNVWAHHDSVMAYWGADRAEWELSTEARNEMLEMLSQLFGEG